MTFTVTRRATVEAGAPTALAAVLYDWVTCDPWSTRLTPAAGENTFTVDITSPGGDVSVVALMELTRRGKRTELRFTSDNAQGTFDGLITVVPTAAGGSTVSLRTTVTPSGETFRVGPLTPTIYTEVVDALLARVRAIATLLEAPGRQLDAAVVASSRSIARGVTGPRVQTEIA